MRKLYFAFILLAILALILAIAGCGSDTPEPTPTPTQPPVTQSPSPTETVPTRTAPPPAPTWTPPQPQVPQLIPAAVLDGLALQFLTDSAEVTSATARQSGDYKTLFLTLAVSTATPVETARGLAIQYIRLVKSDVDTPPGTEIGPGIYAYVVESTHQGGQIIFQGTKCAECATVEWTT